MERVHWDGCGAPDLLYNGGMLWDVISGESVALPGLPQPDPIGRMAWHHCVPADICGDEREELVLYNPWTPHIFVYTQHDTTASQPTTYRPGPRQYNPRLMD